MRRRKPKQQVTEQQLATLCLLYGFKLRFKLRKSCGRTKVYLIYKGMRWPRKSGTYDKLIGEYILIEDSAEAYLKGNYLKSAEEVIAALKRINDDPDYNSWDFLSNDDMKSVPVRLRKPKGI